MSGRWRDLVREEIRDLVQATGSNVITRQALLSKAEPRFRLAFPQATTPGQTMSRVLQELRALGELEFVTPGVYSVVPTSPEEAAQREEDLAPRKMSGERRLRPAMVAGRPFQRPFRSYVLPNFGLACGVCGLSPEWFLEAAHLRPIGTHPQLAGDPSAGVALCKNHHKALDIGALVIERDLTLRIDPEMRRLPGDETRRVLLDYEGRSLRLPEHFDLTLDALPSIGALVARSETA